jgi:acid stress-induced BolA-like protein IbaG/YrbA
MYSVSEIRIMVESGLPGSQATVRDLTGGGDHFEVIVITPQFEGKGPVDRHRMVYAALGPAVGGSIHALSLKTLTPKEAEGML